MLHCHFGGFVGVKRKIIFSPGRFCCTQRPALIHVTWYMEPCAINSSTRCQNVSWKITDILYLWHMRLWPTNYRPLVNLNLFNHFFAVFSKPLHGYWYVLCGVGLLFELVYQFVDLWVLKIQERKSRVVSFLSVIISHHYGSCSKLSCLYFNICLTTDLNEIEPNAFLSPFLDVIRSEDTTGPITGLALTSVNKFLSYGLLGEAAACIMNCSL